MELRGLFQYLINQLKKGSGTELVLLEVCFALKFVVIVAFLITCFLFVSFLIVSFLVIHIICFCFFFCFSLVITFFLIYNLTIVNLQELIEQMANVHYTENITEEQLDALAGSETLRFQSTLYGSIRNNKVWSLQFISSEKYQAYFFYLLSNKLTIFLVLTHYSERMGGKMVF
jgi:hypothetical protein